MSLVFDSFVLSFSVLWRFLIVAPFIVIIGFAAAIGVALIFPPLSLLVLTVTFTFACLVGIRAGLGARDAESPADFSSLLMASFKYGVFQLLVYILLIVALGAAVIYADLLGASQLQSLAGTADPEVLWTMILQDQATVAVSAGVALLAVAFSAAMAVPFAAAAYSASTRAPSVDFFWGFGSSFFGIFLVTLIMVVLSYSGPVTQHSEALFVYGFQMALEATQGVTAQRLPREEVGMMVGVLLFGIWLNCWYFAAAAVGFLRHREREGLRKAENRAVQRLSEEDLRALRLSRQQGRSEQD